MNAVKIAPELLLAFQDYVETAGYEEAESTDLPLDNRTLSPQGSVVRPEAPQVNVFLHCDEAAALDHLEGKGIQINTRKGCIRTARLSLENLERLYEEPNLMHVEASHKLHPLMDVAFARVQFPEFRNKTDLTGKGVIIGVVDSGIDSNHPAFQDGRSFCQSAASGISEQN